MRVVKAAQVDDANEAFPLVMGQPEAAPKESTFVVAILCLQTMLLVALLGGGMLAYRHLEETAGQVDAVITVLENPSEMLNRPQLVHSLSSLLRNSTSDFFFGSSDGSVAAFISSLMATNFGPWANTIHQFSTDLMNSALSEGQPTQCWDPVSCQPESEVQCANGAMRWCHESGMANCATDHTCLAPSIATGASLVSSVSSKLRQWRQVQNSDTYGAAFSNGIFRLDYVTTWVEAQARSSAWVELGSTCDTFVTQVKSINWNGTYVGPNGNINQWNANEQVRKYADYVDQVCSVISSLDAVGKKSTTKAAAHPQKKTKASSGNTQQKKHAGVSGKP